MLKAILSITILLIAFSSQAQEASVNGQMVQLTAEDGLTLVADIYYPADASEPHAAVMLLHMLNSDRQAYMPLIPSLLDANYVVLNVDLRGHGATGGNRDWDLAQTDAQRWLDWLTEQETVQADQLAIIGASIGSNLALIACEAHEACQTAIALSPGTDYRGVQPADSLSNGLEALLIASHDDSYSADSVRTFFSQATGRVSAHLYDGNAHGTRLFDNELDSVANTITTWLAEHLD